MDVARVQRRLGVRDDNVLGPVTLAAILVRSGAPAGTAKMLALSGVAALAAAKITDEGPRLAHFIAQTGHETASFRSFVELWGPTAAQQRYEPGTDLADRLGNTMRGDGLRFRGRGMIQITGRDNYRHFGGIIGVDLIADPPRAAEPDVSMRLACAYWTDRDINADADRDDVKAVTRKINGGLNGIEDRTMRLVLAKRLLL